jgi:ribose-phosphate pyrophosphokinase
MVIKDVSTWKFPAGEVGVKLLNPNPKPTFEITSSDDIMEMLCYLNAKRLNGTPEKEICIPYMPYSRQDRVINAGDCVPMSIIAQALATEGVQQVHTEDIHSPVAFKIFNASNIALTSTLDLPYINTIINAKRTVLGKVAIVAPDKGARDRAMEVVKLNNDYFICLEKKRDEAGKITSYNTLPGGASISSFDNLDDTLIVCDDICDGGATFVELGKLIKERAPHANVHLIVTHGIFSKGRDVLKPYYDSIHAKHTFLEKAFHERNQRN